MKDPLWGTIYRTESLRSLLTATMCAVIAILSAILIKGESWLMMIIYLYVALTIFVLLSAVLSYFTIRSTVEKYSQDFEISELNGTTSHIRRFFIRYQKGNTVFEECYHETLLH